MKPSPIASMNLSADERGVSEVIGAILVFGLLVALLSIIQLQAVPNANAGVEYEHSQAVQGDLDRLDESIDRTVETGNSESVGVELGTQYPTRLVTFNPPAPEGTLRTENRSALRIDNASASGPAGVLLNGREVEYRSHSLVYEADYNEYDSGPRRVREVGIGYNDFEDGTVLRTQPFIDGSTIELVTFNRSFNEGSSSSKAIEPTDVSGPATTVPVENADTNESIRIEVPTALDNETWTEALESELVGNGGHIESFGVNETTGRLVVHLEPGVTYDLRMADVGFGDVESEDPLYMVSSPGSKGPASVDVGREGSVSVEVRDKYNNPVGGVDLTAELFPGNGTIANGSHSGTLVNVSTNASGIATVTYDAPNSFDAEAIQFSPQANDSTLRPTAAQVLTGFAGDQSVVMRGAGGNPDSSQLTLRVQNLGEQREVLGVELNSAKEVSGTQVAARSGVSGTLAGIGDDLFDLGEIVTGSDLPEVNQVDASNISYSPGGIEAIKVNNGSESGSFDLTAPQGAGPDFVTSDQLPSLGVGEVADLRFTFNSDYQVGSGTVFVTEITVYYTGGQSETYQIQFAGDSS
jgi:hypothetical protein